jgi:Holliday junction resolvase-like predicted endonuclease
MDRFADCIDSTVNGSIVSLREKQAKIIFNNPNNYDIIKIRPEKCSVLNKKRCDWLLIIEKIATGIFVELKGRHYEEGVEQIKNTVTQVKGMSILKNMKAYLVTNNCPTTTRIQKDKIILKKMGCSFESKGQIADVNL